MHHCNQAYANGHIKQRTVFTQTLILPYTSLLSEGAYIGGERSTSCKHGTWTSDIYEIVIVKSKSCTKQAITSLLGEHK